MGLYKRGNIWWFSITIKGKQFRFSTRTADRKKATEIYARALLELDNPGKENEPVTFNDFMVNQYLPFTERQNSYQSKKYYFKVIHLLRSGIFFLSRYSNIASVANL